jgi:type I restriction enzyme S subunit
LALTRKHVRTVLSYIRPEHLPLGWNLVPVSDLLIDAQYGLNHRNEPEGAIPIVGMKDIRDGRVLTGNLARTNVSVGELNSYRLRRGDLLINRTNSLDQVGKVGLVKEDQDVVFASYLVRLTVDRSMIEPEFLNTWLNSDSAQRTIRRIATPAIGQVNLNSTEFQKYCLVPLPPTFERLRISEVLGAWDQALLSTEHLILAKEKLYASFSGSLLSGRRRLLSDHSSWSNINFSEVTNEVILRNGNRFGSDVVMGVNKARGMIPMREHVRSDDLTRYKIVPSNAFAYNPMRLNIGSIAMNTLKRETLVSPDYVVFSVRPNRLNHRFFDHLRRSAIWGSFVVATGTGSVRVRIYYEHLSTLRLHVPDVQMQSKIADVLDAAKQEIDLLRKQLNLLNRQRYELRRKLLTGEWRVPLREPRADDLTTPVATETAQ